MLVRCFLNPGQYLIELIYLGVLFFASCKLASPVFSRPRPIVSYLQVVRHLLKPVDVPLMMNKTDTLT